VVNAGLFRGLKLVDEKIGVLVRSKTSEELLTSDEPHRQSWTTSQQTYSLHFAHGHFL
jgi:hypothetical protein